jgi:hypothetical protein
MENETDQMLEDAGRLLVSLVLCGVALIATLVGVFLL